MRIARLHISRGWVAGLLVGFGLIGVSLFFDGRTPSPHGYGKQTGAVLAAVIVTALLVTLARAALRAEHRRREGRRLVPSPKFVGILVGSGTAAVAVGAAASRSPEVAIFGVALILAVVVPASWPGPASMLAPAVFLWTLALPFIGYSVVDAWRNPLPGSFVPIGGMDGIGQDSNSDAGLTIFFCLIAVAYSLVPQLIGLFLGWILRGLAGETARNRAELRRRATLG